MALRHAKIQPTLNEKRYITLQHLEAGYVSGNRVVITPVDTYNLTSLSGEEFTYKEPVETYIIYDERPKVGLLKKFGWYREDEEELPQIAFIPTHLLYDKVSGEVINEVLLEGEEFQDLVQTGESATYELRPLEIKRGTLIDVYFDFAPGQTLPAPDGPYDFAIDNSTVVNRFYVTKPIIDTVSINYTCRLMPFKYPADKESGIDQNPSNGEYLNFDSDEHGV